MSSTVESQRRKREAELEEIRSRRLANTAQQKFDSLHQEDAPSPSSTTGVRTVHLEGDRAAFKAKLESQSTNHIVVSMQDHFYKQRKEKNMARERAKEAEEILHSYHGDAELAGIFAKKDSDNYILYTTEDQELYKAVDRNVDEAAFKVSMMITRFNSCSGDGEPSPTKSVAGSIQGYQQMIPPKVFISVIHDIHGILLLKRKGHETAAVQNGSIFELPGGSVEPYELTAAERVCGENPRVCALTAAKIAAARLLFDNVGIDVRKELLRLQPTSLRNQSLMGADKEMNCEINGTLFFNLYISDGDIGITESMSEQQGNLSIVKLNLHNEYAGFEFERNPFAAAEKVRLFSQSICHDALQLAITRSEIATIYSNFSTVDTIEIPSPKQGKKSFFSCLASCFG